MGPLPFSTATERLTQDLSSLSIAQRDRGSAMFEETIALFPLPILPALDYMLVIMLIFKKYILLLWSVGTHSSVFQFLHNNQPCEGCQAKRLVMDAGSPSELPWDGCLAPAL